MAPNDPATRALLSLWLWSIGWLVAYAAGLAFLWIYERRARRDRWWRRVLEQIHGRRREW